ncbi:GAF domain-containing protein [Albimonas pacifica]|uniref:GAF domain-containing protein n=1 Tax=Albimonas pacifica TaxID=1114924 RepID=A0A1I3MAQ3_9RHOB|nr:GAF domain-containing protein [Albimonas pacifica]SFI93805.1 GAF domain-containing protein [Albimonas pacifica]
MLTPSPADAAQAAMAPLPADRPFIRATEVWVPDAHGARLRLASGLYGDMAEFAAVSGAESFGVAEGLPGKAWAEGRPVVLKGFRGSYFKRTEAAEAAGLTAAVAVPVFAGRTLKGVVVFLFGDDAAHVGAVEVWRASQEPGAVMRLLDGYYGAAEHFEWISRRSQFPRRAGLPGTVWASGSAALFRNLGASHRFIRAEGAAQAGLTTGLGLPVPSPTESAYVLTLLSALGTPIARRFEIWEREGDGPAALVDAVGDGGESLFDGAAPPVVAPGEGLIGQALATGVPAASDAFAGAPANAAERAAAAAGFGATVVFPIHSGDRATQVAAWYFRGGEA